MVDKFLSKKVPPHRLVSVSFFEESHTPNDIYEEKPKRQRKLNATILHRAGEEPEDLLPPRENIYELKVIKGTNWHEEVSTAK